MATVIFLYTKTPSVSSSQLETKSIYQKLLMLWKYMMGGLLLPLEHCAPPSTLRVVITWLHAWVSSSRMRWVPQTTPAFS